MRFGLIVVCLLSGGAAWAHPGHLAEVAGHGHWIAAGALAAAIALGLLAAKGRKKKAPEAETEETPEDEPQEA